MVMLPLFLRKRHLMNMYPKTCRIQRLGGRMPLAGDREVTIRRVSMTSPAQDSHRGR